jgi:hypothetical protein
METISVDKQKLVKFHKDSNQKERELLENLFGHLVFTGKITDRVKLLDDALNVKGLTLDDIILPKLSHYLETFRVSLQAETELIVIIETLNEGWVPDWTNYKQEKWYPWFQMSPGFGFSLAAYVYSRSITGLGSRLYLRNAELARYAGEQFTETYRRFLTNKP